MKYHMGSAFRFGPEVLRLAVLLGTVQAQIIFNSVLNGTTNGSTVDLPFVGPLSGKVYMGTICARPGKLGTTFDSLLEILTSDGSTTVCSNNDFVAGHVDFEDYRTLDRHYNCSMAKWQLSTITNCNVTHNTNYIARISYQFPNDSDVSDTYALLVRDPTETYSTICNFNDPMGAFTVTNGLGCPGTSTCNVSCASGFVGTATATCNVFGDDFILKGCHRAPGSSQLPYNQVVQGYTYGHDVILNFTASFTGLIELATLCPTSFDSSLFVFPAGTSTDDAICNNNDAQSGTPFNNDISCPWSDKLSTIDGCPVTLDETYTVKISYKARESGGEHKPDDVYSIYIESHELPFDEVITGSTGGTSVSLNFIAPASGSIYIGTVCDRPGKVGTTFDSLLEIMSSNGSTTVCSNNDFVEGPVDFEDHRTLDRQYSCSMAKWQLSTITDCKVQPGATYIARISYKFPNEYDVSDTYAILLRDANATHTCNFNDPMGAFTVTNGLSCLGTSTCNVSCAFGFVGTATATCNVFGDDFILKGCHRAPGSNQLPYNQVVQGYTYGHDVVLYFIAPASGLIELATLCPTSFDSSLFVFPAETSEQIVCNNNDAHSGTPFNNNKSCPWSDKLSTIGCCSVIPHQNYTVKINYKTRESGGEHKPDDVYSIFLKEMPVLPFHEFITGGTNGSSVDLNFTVPDSGQMYFGTVCDRPGQSVVGTTFDSVLSILDPNGTVLCSNDDYVTKHVWGFEERRTLDRHYNCEMATWKLSTISNNEIWDVSLIPNQTYTVRISYHDPNAAQSGDTYALLLKDPSVNYKCIFHDPVGAFYETDGLGSCSEQSSCAVSCTTGFSGTNVTATCNVFGDDFILKGCYPDKLSDFPYTEVVQGYTYGLDMWFNFTAEKSGKIRVATLCPTSFDSVIYLFEAGKTDKGDEIKSCRNDNSNTGPFIGDDTCLWSDKLSAIKGKCEVTKDEVYSAKVWYKKYMPGNEEEKRFVHKPDDVVSIWLQNK